MVAYLEGCKTQYYMMSEDGALWCNLYMVGVVFSYYVTKHDVIDSFAARFLFQVV